MGILRKVFRTKHHFSLVTTIAILWISRLVTLIAFPKPVTSPDSSTYYSGQFLDFNLVSVTGHAARGWFVPAIFSFMPNSSILEFFQLCLSGIAWTYLLLSVSQSVLFTSKFTGYLLILLTIIGSSVQVLQHDTTVLSTSISNSLFVALLALLIEIKFHTKISKINLFCVLLIAFILSIQKTTFLPFAIVAIFLSFSTVKNFVGKRTKALFIICALLAGVSTMAIGINVNNSWQVSYSGQTLLWQLGGQSPVADEFGQYLTQAKAPSCVIDDVPYANLDISIGKILNDCPAGSRYIKSSIQKDFLHFAVTHPSAIAKLAVLGMGATLTDSASNYGNAVSIFPRTFGSIFFGESYPNIANSNIDSQVAGMNLLNSGKAIWIYTPLLLWVLVGTGLVLSSRSRRRDGGYLLLIMTACLTQAIFVVVLLPSEWVRQTSPFILGTLITSVILCLKCAEAIYLRSTNSDVAIAT